MKIVPIITKYVGKKCRFLPHVVLNKWLIYTEKELILTQEDIVTNTVDTIFIWFEQIVLVWRKYTWLKKLYLCHSKIFLRDKPNFLRLLKYCIFRVSVTFIQKHITIFLYNIMLWLNIILMKISWDMLFNIIILFVLRYSILFNYIIFYTLIFTLYSLLWILSLHNVSWGVREIHKCD